MGVVRHSEIEANRQRLLESLEGHRDAFPRIWMSFASTMRHLFVPPSLVDSSYEDRALPIKSCVSISQPSLVLRMTELLDPQPRDIVLEVGTGTGYQTAILAQLCAQVFTIELEQDLLTATLDRLRSLHIVNVEGKFGDGSLGWPEHAPYQRIIVTAAPKSIPSPLISQLSDDSGRMVLPVGEGDSQDLLLITKEGNQITEKKVGPVVFVPMRTPKSDDA